MWTRKELKENAKRRFSANYWMCVLAGLILMIVLGGTGVNNNSRININKSDVADIDIDDVASGEFIDEIRDEIGESFTFRSNNKELEEAMNDLEEAFSSKRVDPSFDWNPARILIPIIGGIVLIICVAIIIATALSIFIMNPLEVGGRKFFIDNHDSKGKLGVFGLAFSSNYGNVVLGMFLKGLFTFLWSLLFIIPGIIKSYEYRMIPYLLAENPDMNHAEAFETSKKMMSGNKWAAFVLDLSFIGWHILNAFTFGLLGVFYVNPYVYQTDAELYFKLKELSNSGSRTENVEYDSYVEVE